MIKNNIKNWMNNNLMPVLFIIGGIIAETTDLIVELLYSLNAPLWIGSLFKIIVIMFGAFRLYYSIPKNKRNITNYKKKKENNGL
jgi:hypothetical protein